jgi:hypothetical protein
MEIQLPNGEVVLGRRVVYRWAIGDTRKKEFEASSEEIESWAAIAKHIRMGPQVLRGASIFAGKFFLFVTDPQANIRHFARIKSREDRDLDALMFRELDLDALMVSMAINSGMMFRIYDEVGWQGKMDLQLLADFWYENNVTEKYGLEIMESMKEVFQWPIPLLLGDAFTALLVPLKERLEGILVEGEKLRYFAFDWSKVAGYIERLENRGID